MGSKPTTIRLSEETHASLKARKVGGESFEDVVQRLLDNTEEPPHLRESNSETEEQIAN
jgi:predicted CopG family antitoxin